VPDELIGIPISISEPIEYTWDIYKQLLKKKYGDTPSNNEK
jgi:hypothetical protein